MPTEMEDYLFDLRGYLVLEGAVGPEQVRRINAAIDAIPPLADGEWFGNVQGHSYHGEIDGRNLQNIVEGGAAFEELIDHPGWIEHVRRYVGESEGLFIDECFVTLRGPSEFINLHNGGDNRRTRYQFRYHNGRFHCGQINVLLALTDIGEGDGPTVVIPGSHKSNLPHPTFRKDYREKMKDPPELEVGAVPVYLKAGDAILFVDCVSHGGASRTNPGIRRTLVYRYGPYWGQTRLGYQYSPELIARLTPERAKILQPIPPRRPPC
jgi:hypothetical protein